MQLYICDRNYCDFMVYHESEDSSTHEYFVETITKCQETDKIWRAMKEKLICFYKNLFVNGKIYMCDVAPEIVCPTLPKQIPFRQPS